MNLTDQRSFLTCQLCDDIRSINKEAIVDPDDIIVLFETEIGEGKLHISVDVTNDCPYTVEVVWVRLWEVGGGDDVRTAEINIASTRTFEREKQRVEEG